MGLPYLLKNILILFHLHTLSLIKSLEEKPNKDWLRKIHECGDEKVLKYFLKDMEGNKIENNRETLELLWECYQIPDFVKKTYGNHIEVISKVFNFLNSNEGKITNDYMRLQLMKLDKLEGNVDSLSNRIANVRTWSYVSNKINWVENQNYWIEKQKYQKIDCLKDCMKNLPEHSLIKEQVFLQED